MRIAEFTYSSGAPVEGAAMLTNYPEESSCTPVAAKAAIMFPGFFKHGQVKKLFAWLDGWTATRVRAHLEGRKSRWAIRRIPKAELTWMGLVRLEEAARWRAG